MGTKHTKEGTPVKIQDTTADPNAGTENASSENATTESSSPENTEAEGSFNIFSIKKLVTAKTDSLDALTDIYETVVERRAEAIKADRITILDNAEKKLGELNSELNKLKPDLGAEYDGTGKRIKEHDKYSEAQGKKRGELIAKIKKITDVLAPILSGKGNNKDGWSKLADAIK